MIMKTLPWVMKSNIRVISQKAALDIKVNCYYSDERKTTKQENDKLDKFKHSSKNTGLIWIR